MKFKYTALGANNQKLEGILEAETLEVAREQLHKMNLSVVAIAELTTAEEAATEEEIRAKKSKEGIKTYFFVALDSQKKEVNGTIDSREPSSAFRRLMMEYQFDVLDLYPEDAADPAAESLKPEFEEWKQMVEEEAESQSKKPGLTRGEPEEEKVNEEIVAEMDAFIINTKTILKDFRAQYSDLMIREIERVLGELERIRASNNLKHITKLCNELYELISNPDATNPEQTDEKYEEVIEKIKGSGFIANSFQLLKAHSLQKKLARFEKIQTLFSKIEAVFRGKKGQEAGSRLEQKMKSGRARWLSSLTRSLKGRGSEAHPTLMQAVSKFFSYIQAPNSILRRARKQEMIKAYNAWKRYRQEAPLRKKAAAGAATSETGVGAEASALPSVKPKRDFSAFFAELDSFVGWLLFFYISYFFLVSFAIEKNVGLSKTLVLKTLSSPMILNISIFLVVAHLAFTLKIRYFKSNFLGSLFLFFLSFGLYAILIINL